MSKLTSKTAATSKNPAELFAYCEEQKQNEKVAKKRLAELLAELLGVQFPSTAPKDDECTIMDEKLKEASNKVRKDWESLYKGDDGGFPMFYSRLERRLGFRRIQAKPSPVKKEALAKENAELKAQLETISTMSLEDRLDEMLAEFFPGHSEALKALSRADDDTYEAAFVALEAVLKPAVTAKPARKRM